MSQQTKYEMDEVEKVDVEKLRKLPRFWRKANVGFQFFMILLSFANVIMTVVDADDDTNIPKLYFQIYSCVISLGFVVWNKMLDSVKEYVEIDNPSGPDIPVSTSSTLVPSTIPNTAPNIVPTTVRQSNPELQLATSTNETIPENTPTEPIIPEILTASS